MLRQCPLSRGDLALNSEAACQHWLSWFEYHRKDESAAAIAEFCELLPLDAVRPIFMMMLVERIKAISMLAQLVDRLLALPVESPSA